VARTIDENGVRGLSVAPQAGDAMTK